MRRLSLLSLLVVTITTLSLFSSVSLLAQKKSYTGESKGYAKYVTIPGAKAVGSEQCVACHKEISGNYRHAFHSQVGVDCEECHGNGSAHIDGGGDITKIVSYTKRTAREADGACLSCHGRDEKISHAIASKHASNGVRCLDCHQIHQPALRAAKEGRSFDQTTRGAFTTASVSPETNAIIRPMWESNDACLKCHPSERAQLSMPYHHPLREGKMSCVDCHDPHGGPSGNNLRMANTNQLCLSCHAQYRGPYAYQHPPVTENCMLCHTAHGSPNTNLLSVSEPALCLQCHADHHDGASLPLSDRCTNCHGSIHGTDVPTPSGGTRFIDKGPSERGLVTGSTVSPFLVSHPAISSSMVQAVPSHVPTISASTMGGAMGMMMSSGRTAPLSSGNMPGGPGGSAGTGMETDGSSAISFTPGAYRLIDGSGYLGRVGEYDSLQQSAGTDFSSAYVSTQNHLTVVSRANVLSGDDYSAATQLTAGERLQVGLFVRSFIQQQDHYQFYAFPVLDVPPGATTAPDSTTDLIPGQSVFGVKRRMGNASVRVKVPKLPVHLFIKGDWQARVGDTQLAYLDEQTQPVASSFCGSQCHFQSQFQPTNYTTRNIGGGAQVDLKQVQLTWEHTFSTFNDRLVFPVGNFTGDFIPSADPFGYNGVIPGFAPPSGPAPGNVAIGNYYINPTSPSDASTDRFALNWIPSPRLSINGNASYMRLRDTYTNYPQNSFGSDETLNWRPIDRFRVTADYHQQNVLNNFTPYYSLYGNVSYHSHEEGLRFEYELPKDFEVEAYYKRNGITRSNATLWPQLYSVDNTDLMTVVPSSFSNTTGLALRYHDRGLWSARAGYEWTGTHHPGYLIVPQSNNRTFLNLWLTPAKWLAFSNDINVTVQNAFPAVPLPDTPNAVPPSPPTPLTQSFGFFIAGLPPTFQRRDRFYTETLSANFRPVSEWNLGLGYSYQQNNLSTYMAFQNDSATGYILDQPLVPYKQITQAYWADSSYLAKQRFGVNFRITYNSSRSGMRPDVNPADAAKLGNACLIAGTCASGAAFDPLGLFPSAMSNLAYSANQISAVIVPQWIGQGKAYYLFPHKFEGGFVVYYGSYRDYWNPNLNGVLRTFTVYVGRNW